MTTHLAPGSSDPRIYKRRLSQHQSMSCERAHGPICRCRCRHLLHGISHQLYRQLEEGLFAKKRALKEAITEFDIVDLVKQVKEVMARQSATV